jgi:hypothetical protein
MMIVPTVRSLPVTHRQALAEICGLGHLIAWESTGSDQYVHTLGLVRMTGGTYLLRDIITTDQSGDQAVYDAAEARPAKRARAIYDRSRVKVLAPAEAFPEDR